MSEHPEEKQKLTLEKCAALQFPPDACEVALGLPAGTVSGDPSRMAEWYRGKTLGEVHAWAAVYSSARNGDVKAQELFLSRCQALQVEETADPEPKKRTPKATTK